VIAKAAAINTIVKRCFGIIVRSLLLLTDIRSALRRFVRAIRRLNFQKQNSHCRSLDLRKEVLHFGNLADVA